MNIFEQMVPRQRSPRAETLRTGYWMQNNILSRVDNLMATDPQRAPALLTAFVVTLPTDAKGWIDAGVKQPKEDMYARVAGMLFTHAARNQEVTKEFLKRLGNYPETVTERLKPDLLEGILLSTLSSREANPNAVAQVVGWVERQLPRRVDLAQLSSSVFLAERSTAELEKLAEEFDSVDGVLATAIQGALRTRRVEKRIYDRWFGDGAS